LIDEDVTEAVDVHDGARGEVEERLFEACGAVGVEAAPGGFAGGSDGFALADGAVGGHVERAAIGGGADELDDLGDDVAGAFNEDGIADLDAEAFDLVLIMEGGSGDGDPADGYGA
jgi:hypothetical protein